MIDADKFVVRTGLLTMPDGGTAKLDDTLTRAELHGMDIGYLVRVKALLPLSASRGLSLLPDMPSVEQCLEEVARLQNIMEMQAAEIDSLRIAGPVAASVQSAPGSANPALVSELQESLSAANKTITMLSVDRDAHRLRADAATAKVAEMETVMKTYGINRTSVSPQSQVAPPVSTPARVAVPQSGAVFHQPPPKPFRLGQDADPDSPAFHQSPAAPELSFNPQLRGNSEGI